MNRIPIILDCDPGVDDAFAIMLAHSHRGFDIRAINPVAGNVEYEHTSRNALDLADLLDIPTRVTAGAERPLVMDLKTASRVHGSNGLSGYDLPRARRERDPGKAWDVIFEEARNFSGKLTIIAVGPLTNIAIAILKYPELKDHVRRIVMMGGSATTGNHSQYGEFNIWVDPHAAEIVFHSGIPVTLFGLNATTQCAITAGEMAALCETGSSVQSLIRGIRQHVFQRGGTGDMERTVTLHDAITVGYLMDEGLAETRPAYVGCETTGKNTCGQTVMDFRGILGKEPNVDVAMVTHREVFLRMLEDMIRFYEDQPDPVRLL